MKVVGIVGAGVMGIDIAATLAASGYRVILKDINSQVLKDAPREIKKNIRSYKMTSSIVREWDVENILNRITFTDSYDDFQHLPLVIESVTEQWEIKQQVYKELKEVCQQDTWYAVNTSCTSITRIASLLPKPDRVIGMHFMNPVPLKEVVETIRGYHTSEETIEKANDLLNDIGKKSILVNDTPGFVSNRLSHLFMNEAAFLVQENVAKPEQIDLLFKKGYTHMMGPLETADLIGLDTVVHSLNVLYEDYQDPKFRCCPLLIKMVDAGLLGRKSGEGFYKYS